MLLKMSFEFYIVYVYVFCLFSCFLLPLMLSLNYELKLYSACTVTVFFCCVRANLKLILVTATVQHCPL